MIYLILPLNRNKLNNNSISKLWYNITITIWMLHTITKRFEVCIDIDIEINRVDPYTWIFTSRIFRFALETTFLFNKYFLQQMAYKLLSQSEKLNKRGILIRTGLFENLLKKISGGTLIRDPRVYTRKNRSSLYLSMELLKSFIFVSERYFQ